MMMKMRRKLDYDGVETDYDAVDEEDWQARSQRADFGADFLGMGQILGQIIRAWNITGTNIRA